MTYFLNKCKKKVKLFLKPLRTVITDETDNHFIKNKQISWMMVALHSISTDVGNSMDQFNFNDTRYKDLWFEGYRMCKINKRLKLEQWQLSVLTSFQRFLNSWQFVVKINTNFIMYYKLFNLILLVIEVYILYS